ncbi:RNA polymerase sigma factor [Arenibacter certesii]|uniref:DNA-directed RNA polymerase sigma-70 factor n=1 Tax=Arenibacter certesii TaxID=228955 RepID=A0A918J6D2_9FLAO|nr:RNA polymerase sigma-70 factor [Arenibacter certesii]GGW51376.1 DNA-directed RNA polymerase sigma-70 factor [Arenibacter certesii]
MRVLNNEDLTEQLIHGNEKAYMTLLDTYQRRLYTYALTLSRNADTAQDIVQNVFLNTWRSRKTLNPDLSLQSFLFKSIYNAFVNHYQQHKANMILENKYVEALTEVVEETNENDLSRMIKIMNDEIDKLPPKCKEIFILSKKEGLTNKEISQHLSISVKAVEAQITKAFGVLRNNLCERHKMVLYAFMGFFKI